MRAQAILLHRLEKELVDVHRARLKAFFTVVVAVLSSARLSLTTLGRAIAVGTTHKHGIKRVDRLLGNKHLHREKLLFYRVLARRVLGSLSRPVIAVDWTAITPNLWALSAAVRSDGRAVVLYAEAHPISRYNKPYVHAAFLRNLRCVLPSKSRPIVAADAGFRSPFMKQIESLNWDYVVRVRKPMILCPAEGRQHWETLTSFFRRALTTAEDHGLHLLGIRARHLCRIIVIRQIVTHRRGYHRPRRRCDRAKQRRAAKEPWVLATSLIEAPTFVVLVYSKRMQIEETFRDQKNPRFGFALSYANTKNEERANVLLLIAAFAHLLAMLIGLSAEQAGLHRGYQASTERRRRVLSLAMLGRLIAVDRLASALRVALSASSWSELRAACASP